MQGVGSAEGSRRQGIRGRRKQEGAVPRPEASCSLETT